MNTPGKNSWIYTKTINLIEEQFSLSESTVYKKANTVTDKDYLLPLTSLAPIRNYLLTYIRRRANRSHLTLG